MMNWKTWMITLVCPLIAKALPGDSLYQLHSKWQNQDGREIELSALQGHPVILAMAYTNCPSSCPMIIEQLRQIESGLKNKTAATFVVASFDAKRDTPAQLKKFAQQRKLDLSHWTLLHGSTGAVQELAAALGLKYKEDAQGEFDHSNLISLLDTQGRLRFQQVGLDKGSAELEQKLSELMKATP